MSRILLLLCSIALLLSGCVPFVATDLVGTWQRMEEDGSAFEDADGNTRGKRFVADGTGVYGNFNSGTFSEGGLFEWTLVADQLTEVGQEERSFVVQAWDGVTVTLLREDGATRYFARR